MDKVSMVFAGDIILGENPEEYFGSVDPVLRNTDVVAGQLEVPYSNRAPELADLNRQVENLAPLKEYFDIVSLAGNHIYDAKDQGVIDTLSWLENNAIQYVGGGLNRAEARKARIVEKQGIRIGFLSYNCTGPSIMTATDSKPGCASVDIVTHYELGDIANPGGPPESIYSWPEPKSYRKMIEEIRDLRTNCDVLCLYLHKGLVHKPIKLAAYEQPLCYGAIDAGVDIIFCSHPHILHGIEVYRGKTIYHSLGNFIAWVPSLSPGFKAVHGKKNEFFDPEEWAKTRIERFGFVPDPEYPTYPFHSEARFCLIARCYLDRSGILSTGCVPMIVDKKGVPRVVKRVDGGEEVFNYLKMITEKAGLEAEFFWDKEEILIR